MRRDDILYKWGVVVDHNAAAIPGAGSCIFLHIWKSSSAPTAGCTAMPESDLVRLLRWLDPARHPILIQLPLASAHPINPVEIWSAARRLLTSQSPTADLFGIVHVTNLLGVSPDNSPAFQRWVIAS